MTIQLIELQDKIITAHISTPDVDFTHDIQRFSFENWLKKSGKLSFAINATVAGVMATQEHDMSIADYWDDFQYNDENAKYDMAEFLEIELNAKWVEIDRLHAHITGELAENKNLTSDQIHHMLNTLVVTAQKPFVNEKDYSL